MNDDAFTPPEVEAPPRLYRPPQKLLVPCPTCGMTVLRGLFVQGKVKKLSAPLTPALGEGHVCVQDQQTRDAL